LADCGELGKEPYDTECSEVIQMAAKVAFLDRVLATYRTGSRFGLSQRNSAVWSILKHAERVCNTAAATWLAEEFPMKRILRNGEAKKVAEVIFVFL
jgi:hypothetical protein